MLSTPDDEHLVEDFIIPTTTITNDVPATVYVSFSRSSPQQDTPHWPVRTGTFSYDVTSIANCALTVRKPWSKDPMKWLQISI